LLVGLIPKRLPAFLVEAGLDKFGEIVFTRKFGGKMKKINNLFALISVAFTVILISVSAQAQILVNEIEIDPPTDVNDRCQYVELRGTPGAVVPANTYFISINSDQSNFGFLNTAVNVGGQTIGTNGTITLINTLLGTCPNRTYPAATTVLNYSAGLSLGQGSEGFYVVQSTTTLAAGQDLDTNDDGVLNFSVTFIDGFNLIFNPQEQYVYGPGPTLNTVFGGDVPDAVTRFSGNNTVLSAGAFFFGELAASPEETTVYAAPFSSNFPVGGVLTPGASNLPTTVPNKSRADFDGDGKTDLSVFRPSEGNWYLQRSTAGFGAINWGNSTDLTVPGDYDGDNKADTAVYRASEGRWYILQSSNGSVTTTNFGLNSDIPVAGDYDGDGKTDIAVFRPSTNVWYILNSGGGTTITTFGTAGDVPVRGDYDGDGKTDIAIFRSGTWWISKSSGGISVINFGLSSDRLVPADYDGDNKDDVAVYRASEGRWYIQRSTNGAVDQTPFGISTDIPAPGDYDGDGRDDIAVYRNGTWYLNQSTAGVSISNFGLASDIAIPARYIP